MTDNQRLEAKTMKTFYLVLLERCQRKSVYVTQGEYGGKCGEKRKLRNTNQ